MGAASVSLFGQVESIPASVTAEIRLEDAEDTDDDSGIRVFDGNTSTLFFNVQGDGAEDFSVFAVADFALPSNAGAIGVSDVSVSFFESPVFFANDGEFAVFMAQNSSPDLIDANANPGGGVPSYQDGNDGLDSIDPAFMPFSSELGSAMFMATGMDDAETSVGLTLANATENLFLDAIQTGGSVRLVVASLDTDVAATFSGASGTAPVLTYTEVVPEPSTYALLLGLGVFAFAAIRRRRA